MKSLHVKLNEDKLIIKHKNQFHLYNNIPLFVIITCIHLIALQSIFSLHFNHHTNITSIDISVSTCHRIDEPFIIHRLICVYLDWRIMTVVGLFFIFLIFFSSFFFFLFSLRAEKQQKKKKKTKIVVATTIRKWMKTNSWHLPPIDD